LKGFGKENVGIFYAHLEYITAIWYILWSFGYFVVIWFILPRFGILWDEKSGNPGSGKRIELPERSVPQK
jgi:hypothetical protein